MKNLFLIIFLIPNFLFGQALSSSDLVNLEIEISSCVFKLENNGKVSWNCKQKINNREPKWSYNEQTAFITFMAPWSSTYFIDLKKTDKSNRFEVNWKSDKYDSEGSTYVLILNNQTLKNYFQKLKIKKRFDNFISFNTKSF